MTTHPFPGGIICVAELTKLNPSSQVSNYEILLIELNQAKDGNLSFSSGAIILGGNDAVL